MKEKLDRYAPYALALVLIMTAVLILTKFNTVEYEAVQAIAKEVTNEDMYRGLAEDMIQARLENDENLKLQERILTTQHNVDIQVEEIGAVVASSTEKVNKAVDAWNFYQEVK